MKIDLDQLLPANISNEAAFHVVKFVRGLALVWNLFTLITCYST